LRLGANTGLGRLQADRRWGGSHGPKVTGALKDDLDGGPAEQTVRFAYEGTEYEIDLSKMNAAAFHKQLAPFLEHACKSGRGHLTSATIWP